MWEWRSWSGGEGERGEFGDEEEEATAVLRVSGERRELSLGYMRGGMHTWHVPAQSPKPISGLLGACFGSLGFLAEAGGSEGLLEMRTPRPRERTSLDLERPQERAASLRRPEAFLRTSLPEEAHEEAAAGGVWWESETVELEEVERVWESSMAGGWRRCWGGEGNRRTFQEQTKRRSEPGAKPK